MGALRDIVRVEAEIALPTAHAMLAHFEVAEPIDHVVIEPCARLDLCLTPRPCDARVRFRDRWPARRFERIGALYMLPPREAAQFRTTNGRQTSVVCMINWDMVETSLDCKLEWTDAQREENLRCANRGIQELLWKLAWELKHPSLAREVMAELIVLQIAIELGRQWENFELRSASGGLAPWRLRLIDDRLESAGAAPSLSELAGLCRLSVRQLSRGFEMSRGASLGDYISTRRIGAAKRMLAAGDNIKSISHILGFASASSFGATFRRAVGMSPRAFRAQYLARHR